MNRKVHIKHPITGGEADVFESSLPHHRAGGWEVVPAPARPAPKFARPPADGPATADADAPADTDTPSADGEPADASTTAPTTTETARSRRKSKE